MADDPELLDVAKVAIGAEHGLSPEQSRRLRGATASELRSDAKLMRNELNLPPLNERERHEHGRFASGTRMNEIIRQASGRR